MNERRYCIIEAVADNCNGLWMGLWITSWFDYRLFVECASLSFIVLLPPATSDHLSKDIVTTVTRASVFGSCSIRIEDVTSL